jgi:hypothetical protein
MPTPCIQTYYCIQNTGNNYDGNYTSAGTYNGYSYWSSDTFTTYYIYNNTNEWCLSDTLGGTCLLVGKTPCTSDCPDLCDCCVTSSVCPTPTPTPTINCDNLDFDALFNCEYTPTPTVTPTNTPTQTNTPTPSQTEICGYLNVDVSVTAYTPTVTPTPTITPSSSPDVIRPYSFSGNVTFNTIEGEIYCPKSYKFQDCYNGQFYYTTNKIITPSGDTLTQFMVFNATVDGLNRCISYLETVTNVIGVNSVTLLEGPLGYSNLGECVNCVAINNPTPTQTPTQTPTPTPTPTPSSPPTCYCVKLNITQDCTITYIDCDGVQENFPALSGSQLRFCVDTTQPIISNPPSSFTTTYDGVCVDGKCPTQQSLAPKNL